MKNLRHTPNFFQYTEMTLAPQAIGNKGSVRSKTQKFSFQALPNFRVFDRSSGIKEVAKACVRYTLVSNRILEGIDRPIDRMIKENHTDNQCIKYDSNKDNIKAISEPCSDIRWLWAIKTLSLTIPETMFSAWENPSTSSG